MATPLFPEFVEKKIRPVRTARTRRREGQLAHEVALDLLEKSVIEIASACHASRSGRDMLRAAFRAAQAAGQGYIDLSVTQWAYAAGVSPDTIHRQSLRLRSGAGPLVSLVLLGSKGRSLESVWRIHTPHRYEDAIALTAEGRLPGHQRTVRGQRAAKTTRARIQNRIASLKSKRSMTENPQVAPLTEGLSVSPSDSQKEPSYTHSHLEVPEAPLEGLMGMGVQEEVEAKTPRTEAPTKEEALVVQALLGLEGFHQPGAQAVARRLRGDSSVAQAVQRFAPQLMKALQTEPACTPMKSLNAVLAHRIMNRRSWVLQVASSCQQEQESSAQNLEILKSAAQNRPGELAVLPGHVLEPLAAWQRFVSMAVSPDSHTYPDHLEAKQKARQIAMDALQSHLGEETAKGLAQSVNERLKAAGIPEGLVWTRSFRLHYGRELLCAVGIESLPE